ncbi:MAG: hypothetical protein K9M81_03685 [Chthoniobacterales bacterium]|nr:hypothetical protein [Chthoniobacterales bacterium]
MLASGVDWNEISGLNVRLEKKPLACEYCSFLNQAEPADIHHFYDEKMGNDFSSAFIVRSGEPGFYDYHVILDKEESLVFFVSLDNSCGCDSNEKIALLSHASDLARIFQTDHTDPELKSNKIPWFIESPALLVSNKEENSEYSSSGKVFENIATGFLTVAGFYFGTKYCLTRIFHTDRNEEAAKADGVRRAMKSDDGSMKHRAVVAIHHPPCLHQDSRRLATNQYEICRLKECSRTNDAQQSIRSNKNKEKLRDQKLRDEKLKENIWNEIIYHKDQPHNRNNVEPFQSPYIKQLVLSNPYQTACWVNTALETLKFCVHSKSLREMEEARAPALYYFSQGNDVDSNLLRSEIKELINGPFKDIIDDEGTVLDFGDPNEILGGLCQNLGLETEKKKFFFLTSPMQNNESPEELIRSAIDTYRYGLPGDQFIMTISKGLNEDHTMKRCFCTDLFNPFKIIDAEESPSYQPLAITCHVGAHFVSFQEIESHWYLRDDINLLQKALNEDESLLQKPDLRGEIDLEMPCLLYKGDDVMTWKNFIQTHAINVLFKKSS